MKNKKQSSYLWERKTDTALQFWPEASIERSLIRPTVPKEFISQNPNDKICAPRPLPFGILENRGIPHSAISEHTKNFYTSRSHEDFNFISYTISGSAILKIDRKTIRLKKGMCFYASHKVEYELNIPNSWKMFFFHLEKSARWNNVSNSVYLVKEAQHLNDIKVPTFGYFNEVYKQDRSLRLLDIYADAIEYFIRQELAENSDKWRKFDNLIAEIKSGELTNAQTKNLARKFNMSVYEFDKQCLKTYGVKFAKLVEQINMQRAKQMLLSENTPTITEISKICGFANVHSFSRAFSRNFGIPPSLFSTRIKKSD